MKEPRDTTHLNAPRGRVRRFVDATFELVVFIAGLVAIVVCIGTSVRR